MRAPFSLDPDLPPRLPHLLFPTSPRSQLQCPCSGRYSPLPTSHLESSTWNPPRPLTAPAFPCHRLPYAGYFGGVSGLSKAQFLRINGFPNEYWGWGGEDDDIFNR